MRHGNSVSFCILGSSLSCHRDIYCKSRILNIIYHNVKRKETCINVFGPSVCIQLTGMLQVRTDFSEQIAFL